VKRNLTIDRILVFNDFPQLFLAKDAMGTNYMCLATHFSDSHYSYISVSLSNKVLYQFLNGKRDLRSVFVEPEIREWWSSNDTSRSTITIELLDFDRPPNELLPDDGFFFTDQLQDDPIRQEVVEHNNVIIHLSLSDNQDDQSIQVTDLGDFTKLYQGVVENAYKKAILRSALPEKKSFILPNNYSLRAFASSPGSFVLHLKSNSSKDLWGNSIIEEGLKMIDNVITDVKNDEKLIEQLRAVKGHTISNYKKLLEKVIKQKVTFSYRWISPASNEIHIRAISTKYAERVHKILESKEELGDEIKILVGFVMQADVEKGGWRITNLEDGKDYSGESSGHLLEGITLETVKYKLTCKELVEALRVTEREKVRYILTAVEVVEE
jgi:hypothetical protein